MAETETRENLIQELESCRKQAEEYLNGWKRAKADYLNLKKETEAHSHEIGKLFSMAFFEATLGILDSFDEAFDKIPQELKEHSWVLGIEGIKKQLKSFLSFYGVEPIVSIGQDFNPEKHEAVETIGGGESGKIAEEIRKGYMIDNRVLRPAKVKIYK